MRNSPRKRKEKRMDSIFSEKYGKFVMPSAEQIKKENYIASLSATERELYMLREQKLNGDISSADYQDAIDCVLFWALENNEITEEDNEYLYKKYM